MRSDRPRPAWSFVIDGARRSALRDPLSRIGIARIVELGRSHSVKGVVRSGAGISRFPRKPGRVAGQPGYMSEHESRSASVLRDSDWLAAALLQPYGEGGACGRRRSLLVVVPCDSEIDGGPAYCFDPSDSRALCIEHNTSPALAVQAGASKSAPSGG
jgi:hypothetical protein